MFEFEFLVSGFAEETEIFEKRDRFFDLGFIGSFEK